MVLSRVRVDLKLKGVDGVVPAYRLATGTAAGGP
jgi:hypothetical protein